MRFLHRPTNRLTSQHPLGPFSPRIRGHQHRTFKTFDFRPSPGTVVLLLTEADYVGSPGQAFKRKVAKFYAQRGACQAVVICQRSELTSLEFLAVQEFVVIHLGLALIPISDQKELPQFLHQLSGVQRKANPFLLGRQPSPAFSVKATPGLSVTVHKELLTTLATIPGLGQKRARALLTHFRTLLAICQASPRDLAQVVGQSQASSVYNFVHAKRAPSKSTR
ncbi:Fanconi anemia core complex-associated protein 24-like isoform X2 [Tigriopus californicus]|uniref:Fanconi anemia core complex-associated protein 24-like isoform X2 n=1 Tax=Tigriopus californicus TaxID=6832 RepID=UPI0027DAA636|nr:Fanconi anemia core complex-associated protein 24-like isoform X2 [Tigriopus californicus]